MSMNYDSYIKLSDSYESVVDLEAEERNPHLWQEYIVQSDMKKTIDAICQTMEWSDPDKRRSFWIHGAYGTGKSYAAIVLKHLFADKPVEIENFLSKTELAPLKKRFIKVRSKGDFLVVWKSGTTGVKSGIHLMMEMEVRIREKLYEKFGDKAYYGQSSLIGAAKEAIENNNINWQGIFENPIYGISDKYGELEDFRKSVLDGDKDDINLVKRICDDLHFSMFTNTVEKFEEWLRDIIAGNNLKSTGIVFIWDEFTGFLRDSGDDNVLQRLSEFCKQKDSPFFMCLIVHRDPTWVNQLGGETYERILHRYHELEFHITESAAYDLIGDSIIPNPGMETQWEDEKKELLKTIEKYKSEFDNLEQNVNIYERMNKLCPLHPMTVSMLATVAQNFGASQRTLFKFMKDKSESSQNVGFIYYIKNNNPDGWYWLTADYLWDYFFTRNSDVRDFNADAKKVIQHYQNKKDLISDEYAKHVFKAAMLLIAVVSGSNVSNLYSKENTRNKINATKRTLYRLFRGQLEESQIDQYVENFEEIGILRLDKQQKGVRLELPYTGSFDQFDNELRNTAKKYTRYMLFSKSTSKESYYGCFSKALELWESTRSTYNRMYIAVCSSETDSLKSRLREVKDELEKSPYKIGILAVSISEQSEFQTFQASIKRIAEENDNGRLIVALLKEPCTNGILDAWYRAITHKQLSANEGKVASANKYEAEAMAEVAKWCASASENQIFACYGKTVLSTMFGKSDLIKIVENNVLYTVFPAAPERIISTHTAFKGMASAIYGLTGNRSNNTQINGVIDVLREIGAWELHDLAELSKLQGEKARPITELAKFIQDKFEQGAKIPLDELWATLGQPPFGYYKSLTAEVFLGLVMRPFVKGKPSATFNWIDNQNNTNEPTADNLASMINKMMSGQTLNNYLSSGSAIWQKFKPYAKAIFGLKDNECSSDTEARKYISSATVKIGVPFWSLKYISAEKLGGEEAKSVIIKITDAFNDFTSKISDDQEGVMDTVFTLFKGRGNLKSVITNNINDKAVMFSAFKNFVFEQTPELQSLYQNLNFSDKDLFDALRVYMQDSINMWRESAVVEKATDLCAELRLIAELNTALNNREKIKTYKALQTVMNNVFDHMKVPGMVIEKLSQSFVPAMKLMRKISKTPWIELFNSGDSFEEITSNAKTAWEYLSQPKLILEAVLQNRNYSFSEDEIEQIYNGLKPTVYETPAQTFTASLDKQIDGISYSRCIDDIKRFWIEKTGTNTIKEWCNKANCPILWLYENNDESNIITIKVIQDGIQVELNSAKNALAFLNTKDFANLSDKAHVEKCFFENIGESYRACFESESTTLFGRLKTNNRLTSDVYSWENKIPDIRRVLDVFLDEKYSKEAEKRVKTKPESDLRKNVLRLLEENPSLYSYFLN